MEVNKYTPEALARLPREELRRMLAEELNKVLKQLKTKLKITCAVMHSFSAEHAERARLLALKSFQEP